MKLLGNNMTYAKTKIFGSDKAGKRVAVEIRLEAPKQKRKYASCLVRYGRTKDDQLEVPGQDTFHALVLAVAFVIGHIRTLEELGWQFDSDLEEMWAGLSQVKTMKTARTRRCTPSAHKVRRG